MIALRRHNSQDYAGLPDIDDLRVQSLAKDDTDCLDEIGDFLVGAQANERFGASLLHRHFPVLTGELFVEEIDYEAQAVTLSPQREVTEPVYAINFRFTDHSGLPARRELIGLEYTPEAVLNKTKPIDETDADIIAGVREILARREKLDRFGIRLIHNALSLGDNWALLESSDSSERVLTSVKVSTSDRDFQESVPTFFQWRTSAVDSEGNRIVSQTCKARCNVTRGCLIRPDGGHESHGSHDPSHERW
jgi:hypothetical protein